jgi:hypothetical protein
MQHLEGSGTPVLYRGRTVLKGLPFYSTKLPLLFSMTPEHSDIFVTLDNSFKNSVDLEKELPHSHPLTHNLFYFRIIVTPRCSKINSSIKPAPASGLDLWGQPFTVTADVRSTIS